MHSYNTHSKYLKVFTQACLSRLKLFWAKGKHKKPGLIWTASWRVWVVRRSRVKGQTVWSNCGSTRSIHPSALWRTHRIYVLISTIPGYAHQCLPVATKGGNGGPDPLQILNPWKQTCFWKLFFCSSRRNVQSVWLRAPDALWNVQTQRQTKSMKGT